MWSLNNARDPVPLTERLWMCGLHKNAKIKKWSRCFKFLQRCAEFCLHFLSANSLHFSNDKAMHRARWLSGTFAVVQCIKPWKWYSIIIQGLRPWVQFNTKKTEDQENFWKCKISSKTVRKIWLHWAFWKKAIYSKWRYLHGRKQEDCIWKIIQ